MMHACPSARNKWNNSKVTGFKINWPPFIVLFCFQKNREILLQNIVTDTSIITPIRLQISLAQRSLDR